MNCDCIKQVNEKLRHAFGTRLSTSLLLGKEVEETMSIPTIQLEESRAPKRQKPQPVLITYCPFCGVKVKKEEG